MEKRRDELMHSFFKMRKALKRIHTGELSGAMVNALLNIDASGDGGISIGKLCKKTQVLMPAMARTLRELELRGLISRRQDTADKRIFYVELTENGRKNIIEGKKRIDRQLFRMIELLGENDTAEMLRLADRMVEVMEQVRQEEEESK